MSLTPLRSSSLHWVGAEEEGAWERAGGGPSVGGGGVEGRAELIVQMGLKSSEPYWLLANLCIVSRSQWKTRPVCSGKKAW
jgi:hypothetical protein